MTEQEWKVCTDIDKLLGCLVEKSFPDAEPCNWGPLERKKRLFVLSCLSRIWQQLPEQYRKAFELLEPEADLQVNDEKRTAVWSAAETLSCEHGSLLFSVGYDDIALVCYYAADIAEAAAKASGKQSSHADTHEREQQTQADLLRDIFGNPFRPVPSTQPGWRGTTAPSARCPRPSTTNVRSTACPSSQTPSKTPDARTPTSSPTAEVGGRTSGAAGS